MAVRFVSFDQSFCDTSWHWLQDEELCKLINTTNPTKDQQQTWFNQLPLKTDYQIWGVTYNNIPVGVSGIKHIRVRSGEYWGYIGDKRNWGKGIGKEMLFLAEQKAKVLDLRQLMLRVLAENIRAVKLYQNAGYRIISADDSFQLMQKELS
jgi:RimJ/RimL family protein N-acetyltransferase